MMRIAYMEYTLSEGKHMVAGVDKGRRKGKVLAH